VAGSSSRALNARARRSPRAWSRASRAFRWKHAWSALPKRYRIPALALPGARKFQQGGVSLSASIGDSEEFLSLRDYRPGIRCSALHWKSFARTGKPIVKEYQDEFFERHALVLDTGTRRGEDAAFEEAVAVAASFVYTIDTQECLLDLLFVGRAVKTYTTGRGQSHAEQDARSACGVPPSPAGGIRRARARPCSTAQRRCRAYCRAAVVG
jgi:uncharacterized protein (DUF58 family)